MQLRFKAIMFAMLFGCAHAQAQTGYQPYFVSGVLQQKDSTTVIRIVQGMVVSDSAANAQVVFSGMAIKQFPGYTMVDVLASTFSQLYKSLPGSATAPVPAQSVLGTGV